eukprot:Hpha_TRINITY_DN16503_c3_g1::TRINITY_DN16503_c3_g1_i2::g.132350::m.132350
MVIFSRWSRNSDGTWSSVLALLDGGAELKRSTLHLALELGLVEMAKIIAERGVDVDSQDEMGRTLLMNEMVRTGGVGGFPAPADDGTDALQRLGRKDILRSSTIG